MKENGFPFTINDDKEEKKDEEKKDGTKEDFSDLNDKFIK
jgi:hypothetical protein